MEKSGTIEDLQKDMEESRLEPFPMVPLEIAMAVTREKLDTSIREILEQSGLSIYLFDYCLQSVMADVRKADQDQIRLQSLPQKGEQ